MLTKIKNSYEKQMCVELKNLRGPTQGLPEKSTW